MLPLPHPPVIMACLCCSTSCLSHEQHSIIHKQAFMQYNIYNVISVYLKDLIIILKQNDKSKQQQ